MRLDQIFGATIPDKIYFNFISVRDRYLKDQITPPLQGLEKLTGSYISGTDDTDYTIDPSLDLLSWRVRVE